MSNYVFRKTISFSHYFATKTYSHYFSANSYFIFALFCYQTISANSNLLFALFCYQTIGANSNFLFALFCYQIFTSSSHNFSAKNFVSLIALNIVRLGMKNSVIKQENIVQLSRKTVWKKVRINNKIVRISTLSVHWHTEGQAQDAYSHFFSDYFPA